MAKNITQWQILGGSACKESLFHIDFPPCQRPHSHLAKKQKNKNSKVLGGNHKHRWQWLCWEKAMPRLKLDTCTSERVCVALNFADRLYRSHLTMRQLKTHLSTLSPYGWMWSGRAPLITFMVLLGAQGAACIIISAQAECWNHKSARHAQAGLVFSWPHGTSHLFGWECLRVSGTVISSEMGWIENFSMSFQRVLTIVFANSFYIL